MKRLTFRVQSPLWQVPEEVHDKTTNEGKNGTMKTPGIANKASRNIQKLRST